MTEQSEESIFGQAVEIQSDEDRAAYLNEACGGDEQLRAEVEKLVADHFRAGSFLEQPAINGDATAAMPPGMEQVGSQIGPYKLRERLGEGGMGVVWAAEQKQPLRRKVALKVIKPGMDSSQVIARFEAEREALALMDHPNIARVLDAGTTEQGRPYFVMELIRGVPITEYCDTHKLTIRERLDLFTHVCKAVQHAHQKGIIHRDIKPSNVLVTEQDGVSLPKVIDFGVAKALHQPLTEQSIYTGVFQAIGTLAYMSPEQATLHCNDIDTRADVYGLGVLLYELITGGTPFAQGQLEGAAFDEACRMIREEDPLKPSTRINTLGKKAAGISHGRSTDPPSLRRAVDGELDWIVMTALDKDRNRRYPTASAFCDDVYHFLNGETVSACPPSVAYRFRKFAQRNRTAICSLAVLLAVILLGLIGTTWQAIRADVERNRAVAARKEALVERDRASVAETELRNTLISLQDEIRESGYVAAAAGDFKGVDAAIDRATLAGISADEITTLAAMRSFHQGEIKLAIDNLEDVAQRQPDYLPARAALTLMYAVNGCLIDYFRSGAALERALESRGVTSDNFRKRLQDYEIYYLAAMGAIHDPTVSADLMGELFQLRQWPIAYFSLARCRARSALKQRSLDDFSIAVRQVSQSRPFLSSPRFVAGELEIIARGIRLAKQLDYESTHWRQEGEILAEQLSSTTYPSGQLARAVYFDAIGSHQQAEAANHSAFLLGYGGLELAVARKLAERGEKDALTYLQSQNTGNAQRLLIKLNLLARAQPNKAREIYRELVARNDTLGIEHFTGILALCQSGASIEEIAVEVRHFEQRCEEKSCTDYKHIAWLVPVAQYLVGKEELSFDVSNDPMKVLAEFVRSCKASIHGDADQTRYHLEKAIEIYEPGYNVYQWSLAYLTRMSVNSSERVIHQD